MCFGFLVQISLQTTEICWVDFGFLVSFFTLWSFACLVQTLPLLAFLPDFLDTSKLSCIRRVSEILPSLFEELLRNTYKPPDTLSKTKKALKGCPSSHYHRHGWWLLLPAIQTVLTNKLCLKIILIFFFKNDHSMHCPLPLPK